MDEVINSMEFNVEHIQIQKKAVKEKEKVFNKNITSNIYLDNVRELKVILMGIGFIPIIRVICPN